MRSSEVGTQNGMFNKFLDDINEEPEVKMTCAKLLLTTTTVTSTQRPNF